MTSNIESIQQVFESVIFTLRKRDLRSGQDDGLAQILQHKTQSRSSICDAIGAMENNEAIEQGVISEYCFRYFGPTSRIDG